MSRQSGVTENAIIVAIQRLHVETLTDELTGSTVDHLERTIGSLNLSTRKVEEIETAYDNLLAACAREGYTGNPLAPSIRQLNLSEMFSGEVVLPTINQQVWSEVEQHINDRNILDTLRWECSRFRDLIAPTRELILVITECRGLAEQEGDDAFVDAVEHNQLPLRQRYARVFSLWNHLHAMFLYSALMTTELFYRVSDLPSLVEQKSLSSGHTLRDEPVEA